MPRRNRRIPNGYTAGRLTRLEDEMHQLAAWMKAR